MRTWWWLLAVSVVVACVWFASGASESPPLTWSDGKSAPEAAPPKRETGKPKGLSIGGRIVHESGAAAVGAAVTARAHAGGAELRTTAVADGAFRFRGLAPGIYHLRASALDGDAPYVGEADAEAGEPYVRIALVKVPRSLVLRVLTPEGEPVPRFDARVLVPGGYRKLGTVERGSVQFEDHGGSGPLPWTGALLELWGARDLEDHGLGLAPTRVGPFGPERGTRDVTLVRGPVQEGVVLGPEGPLGRSIGISMGPVLRWDGLDFGSRLDWDADAEPDWPRGDPSTRKLPRHLPFEGLHTKVRTDEAGRFRISFLQPAVDHELDLDFFKDYKFFRHYAWTRQHIVRAGDGPLEIRLRRHVSATITVLGPDGEPIHGAFVRAGSPGSDGFNAHGPMGLRAAKRATDQKGAIVLDRLHPGRRYKLFVNPYYEASIDRTPGSWSRLGPKVPQAPPNLAERTLLDWSPEDTTVRLVEGYTVAGRVLQADGKPVKERHVGMCTPIGFNVYTTADNGRFEFRGVPAGPVYLGLDDKGSMGGIVDRQRVAMWDASFGGGARDKARPDPPVPAWTKLDVEADVTDLVLRVPVTVGISLRLPPPLVSAPGRSKADRDRYYDDRWVVILCQADDGWVHFRTVGTAVASFYRQEVRTVIAWGLLPDGRYAAWMTPIDGRYVYAEFTGNETSLGLERTPGKTIRGRVSGLPPESTPVVVDVWDERRRYVNGVMTDPDGAFEVTGLPDSTWTVRARCRSAQGEIFEAEDSVETGKSVELHLAPGPLQRPK